MVLAVAAPRRAVVRRLRRRASGRGRCRRRLLRLAPGAGAPLLPLLGFTEAVTVALDHHKLGAVEQPIDGVTTQAALGKTLGHSAKGLLVVSTMDLFFSYLRVTTSKSRSACLVS